jgi:CTP synthase
VPGGFGDRGTEGKIASIGYARENKIPFFGICLGMQLAVVEFARNIAGLEGASSSEFDRDTQFPVIDLLPDQRNTRAKGATMRLGAFPCTLLPGSVAAEAYGSTEISERHRHRYEFANEYREQLAAAGLVLSGTSPDKKLVEMIELTDHPYFVGCQFHPEFKSRPTAPHPLFSRFVRAALERQTTRIKAEGTRRAEAAASGSTGSAAGPQIN